MKTLTINVPEETNEKELKMAIAAVLFDKGILSSGQAPWAIMVSLYLAKPKEI